MKEVREIYVHQVDAFAEKIFGGNPAGVVTNADILDPTDMQNVAREMNKSETAFVLNPTTDAANVRFKFFTPTQEVPFCGHATVGALHELARLAVYGLGKPGENTIQVETGVGVLAAKVTNDEKATKVTLDLPDVEMVPYPLRGEAFAEAFGVPVEFIKPNSTILLDKKLNYVYVPVASLRALRNQDFDFGRIRKQFGKEKITIFSLFTNETVSGDADLHARGLAPNVGIDEDPFTGSMQAGLVSAAKYNGYIDAGQERIITEQGHSINRPGVAEVSHNISDNTFAITASAVHVFSSKWRI